MLMSIEKPTATVDAKWRPDQDAESVLEFVGVTWEVVDVSLDRIDWNESANNCARMLNPYNEEKIEDYQSAQRRGDAFPMVVVEARASGYVILGGNQRCSASKRNGIKSLPAYCVKSLTTTQNETIIRSLNARHGWGTSKEERIDHAVYLVRKHGVSASDAAKLLIVSEVTIFQRIRAEDVRASLARHGIESNGFKLGHLDAIARVPDEEMQAEVGRVVARFTPSCEQVKSICSAVASQKNRAQMSSKIKEWSKSQAGSIVNEANGRTEKKMKRPRRDKFIRHLESMSEFLERGNDGTGFSTLDELQCNASLDGDKIRTLVQKITIRLNAIAGGAR